MARSWGFWTRGKLDILREYLQAFTRASARAPARVYLDLFSGEPQNEDRLTRASIDGSAAIALLTVPTFDLLYFFERPATAAKLEAALTARFPNRVGEFFVYPGDCNVEVHKALADIHHRRKEWGAHFAFIDPNGAHFTWRTLQSLAAHKPKGARTKVELWILFADAQFSRLLPSKLDRAIRVEDERQISAMFGCPDWHEIYQCKLEGRITASEARAQYVELFRWRLQHELGYRWTHQLEVHNEQSRPLYRMVFATDSQPGHDIMTWLYDTAAEAFPRMLQELRGKRARMRREAEGQFDLFGDADTADAGFRRGERVPGEKLYEHQRPEEPRPHDSARCPHCAGAPGITTE